MILIAGLGNPGTKYTATRHNIGFALIQQLADSLTLQLKAGKGPFLAAKGNYEGQQLILVQPTTFMNNSGKAIQQATRWYKIPAEKCLICYDDLNLKCGTLRMRNSGSAGGHNGIKDIIQKLGTDRFPRLRIGIGNDFREGEQTRYVLSRFDKNQLPVMEKSLDNATEAVLQFVREGIEVSMNNYN